MRKLSPAMAVALAALFVALGGVGVAATGSFVNIVDKSYSTRVARVTSGGALRVESQVGAPGATNYWRFLTAPGWVSMVSNTGSATRLAVGDVSLTGEGPQGDQTAIVMSYVIPSTGSCSTPTDFLFSVMHRRVIVPNQSTVQLTFPAPLYAPYAGSTYQTCFGVRLVSAPSGSTLYAAAIVWRSD